MTKHFTIAILLTLAFAVTAAAQDADLVIGAATLGMGAGNLKTLQYSGPATEYSFGQAFNPKTSWPEFKNKTYTRTIDYDMPAIRIDRVAEPIEPGRKGGGLAPAATQTIVVGANTAWGQQLEIWKTPFGFLKAAKANKATRSYKTVGGKKYTVLSFTAPTKAKVNGYFNDQYMLEKVETWIDNAVTGDTLLEVTYSGYKDFNGVKFPTLISEKQAGLATLNFPVTDVKVNQAAGIQAPQNRGGAPAGGGAAAQGPAATSQKLGDGVYMILPGYAAIAVDFKDGIMIIEGPQSEARGNAIITEAKRVIPNKPIKYVVNTHIHFDHSSGLRAFVAEGATILTHQINKGYWEKMLATPHSLNPDRQETAKKKISVQTFGDKKVFTDGNHVVELHRLQGGLHQEGMIVAYLPKEKVLLEADAFNPPAQANAPAATPPAPATVNLVLNIERLKLDVETIVPVHYPADGRKVTKAELMKAAGRGQ